MSWNQDQAPRAKPGPKPTGKAKPLAARVAQSRAKAIAAGGDVMSTLVLTPDAVKALETLLQAGYAPSKTAAINRALIDAVIDAAAKVKELVKQAADQ